MNGISLFEVIDLIPRAGVLLAPVAAAMTTYVVCEVLRIPEKMQWIATGIAFAAALLIIVGIWLFRRFVLKQKGGKLEDGLAGGEGDTAALRAQWKDSIKKLKGTAVGGGGSRALAALPWFVIIGAPASGKSTLLRQSGIDFPVGDAAIRGLQGTRNCDWWFSNVGVFLDTAGRYISDSSAAEWAQFLDLVRRHRTGAPIHGVIVALPAPDLLSRSEQARELDARRLRARLDELIDHLGVNFPVWVVLTKVDLIGGFAEFFGHADAATRAQIIGWTAEQGEGGRFDAGAFARRFKAMVHRMREMRPALIASAPLRDRPAAFAFPDEFGSVEEPLSRMLQRIFEPNVYQETPLFRGLYVTSATQQGSPLQRAASRIRELLGAPQVDADASGSVVKHAYFVKDLMHERIVADQSMTWTTDRELERGKNRRLGINLMGASFGVMLFLVVIGFGLKAMDELKAVESEIQRLEKGSAVARCEALRRAALKSSADPVANLGLSQQLRLRLDAGEEQSRVYRASVLNPLLSGWAESFAAADTSQGVDNLIDSYEDFLLVQALLERAIDQDAPPPGSDADAAAGGTDDDEENLLRGPRDDYFTEAERQALLDRAALLYDQGIIASKDPAAGVEILLDVIWHNHGCSAWFDDPLLEEPVPEGGIATREKCAPWAVEGVQRVHDAFRAALKGYVDAAAAAIDKVKDDQEVRKKAVDRRLGLLKQASDDVREQLSDADFKRQDLEDSLQDLAEAAAGVSVRKDGDGSVPVTDDGPAVGIGSAVSRIRALQERPQGAPSGVSGDLGRLDVLQTWESGDTSGSDDVSARLRALSALSKLLSEQSARVKTKQFLPLEFQLPAKDAANLESALVLLANGEDAAAKSWLQETRKHLAQLVGKPLEDYVANSVRWGLGVENIVPTLYRDELMMEFLEKGRARRGKYNRLAGDLVEEIEANGKFDLRSTGYALDELLRLYEDGLGPDSLRPLTKEALEAAQARAAEAFAALLQSTQEHWDRQCAFSVPRYRKGNEWVYLTKWTEATAGLQTKFATDWGTWDIPTGLAKSAVARSIWNGAAPGMLSVAKLRDRYAFYGDGNVAMQDGLGALIGLERADLPESLEAIAEGLGRTVPAWRGVGTEAGAAAEVAGNTIDDLVDAVQAAEDNLVTRVEEYFDARWGDEVRPVLVDALGGADEEQRKAAEKELNKFLRELRDFFGRSLTDKPGKRLKLASGFPKSWAQVVGKTFSPEPFTISFRAPAFDLALVGGTQLSKVRLIYTASDSDSSFETWMPNEDKELSVRWSPRTGTSFQIWMVNDDGGVEKLFREWGGDMSLINAIRAGGGVEGDTVRWEGKGDFSKYSATFTFRTGDRQMIRDILNPPKGGTGAEIPDTCVERL